MSDLRALQARIAALEADNAGLRIAASAAEARASNSAAEFLLRDAGCGIAEGLVCEHAAVPGRVTVIIPAFNAEAFLERAVRSVWSQTIAPDRVEILVVDDGSRDGTRALADRLAARSRPRMQVLVHPSGRNRGVSPTRQLAARHASGEFVALLDADDAFLPERLEAGLTELTRQPDAVALCSLGCNVNGAGERVIGHNGTTRAGEWRGLADGLEPPFTFDQLWRVDPIANSSLLIRREALERVGGFPWLMAHQAEDWLLVLKLSLLAPIPCIERELILYTHHPGAYTNAYHASGWRDGARLETFYQLAWWMLRSAAHADAGARFFRREYPNLIADYQRLLPLLREYYASGGRPAEGAPALGEHLMQMSGELEAMRRVLVVKVNENKRLRRLLRRRLGPAVHGNAVADPVPEGALQ